ncbi:ribosomal protein L35 [Microbacterium sp. SORGH_AS 888]|nr:ribosomal protein L35 [Microbacterium sp. SORGH_AS_0888]
MRRRLRPKRRPRPSKAPTTPAPRETQRRKRNAEAEDALSGAKKRFKVTGSGKIKKQQANLRHNFEGKPTKRTRRLSADKILAPGDAKVAKKLLGI